MFGMKASNLSGIQLVTHSGVVDGLNSEVEEHIDHDPVDTNLRFLPPRKVYVAHFTLNGRAIEAKFQMPFQIANGDEVSVSGYTKNNFFNVLAFRNESSKVIQSNSWKVALGAGIGFSILSLIILIKLFNEQSMVFPQILLGIFVGIGLYIANYGLLVKQARDLL